MLFSLLTLVIAWFAFQLSYRTGDEITALLILLGGLFSLFLSIVSSIWLIKLVIIAAIVLMPGIHPRRLQPIHSFFTVRSR